MIITRQYKVKRNSWPKVCGVTINPVQYPRGGGNHLHTGFPSTVRRDTPAGREVSLITAKSTGRIRGILASVSSWPFLIIESLARVSQQVLLTQGLLVKQV